MLLSERKKHSEHWENVKKEILVSVQKDIMDAYPDGRMPDFIARQISEYWQSLYKLTHGGGNV